MSMFTKICGACVRQPAGIQQSRSGHVPRTTGTKMNNKEPFGHKLLESDAQFVIHSERGEGEDTILVEDFLSSARQGIRCGLLAVPNDGKRRLIYNSVGEYFGYQLNKTTGVLSIGRSTLRLVVMNTDVHFYRRIQGWRFDWLGLHMSHMFTQSQIDLLRTTLMASESKIRGISCPDNIPAGTWVQQ